jgi:putative flippase GtrA
MVSRQFAAFLGVGLASAAVDLTTTGALIWLGLHYGVAASAGFALGLWLNFMGHSGLSFPSTRSAAMVMRFSMVTVMNYLVTLALVTAGVHWLQSPMLGKLLSIPVVAIHGFLWGKYWVFK